MNSLHLTDTHLEYYLRLKDFYSVVPKKIADIVFLTGDIAGGTYALPFIEHLLNLGYKVIYVLGNHEFYGHDVVDLIQKWRDISKDIENFYFFRRRFSCY